jgi:2-dehydropantoate 2-reductase
LDRNTDVKIAVLGGGGAMGGLFGGRLAEAGYDTVLVDVSTSAVAAIKSDGLRIEEKDGSFRTIRIAASSDPSSVGQVDLVVNFVKSYHTAEAIRSAAPMIGPKTAVLSLQNGWGNAPRISEIVGERRVLVGLTYHAAMLRGPGLVKHPSSGMTYVGETDGSHSPRLVSIVDALRHAGFEVTESGRILDEVWKKLALNAATLPIAALLRLFAHQLLEHEDASKLMRGLLSEIVSVATKQGIAVDFDERWETITGLLARAVGGKGSMLQDVEAKRRTEIDVINGAIVEAGERCGVATPLNAAMVWLVNSMQEAYLAEANG